MPINASYEYTNAEKMYDRAKTMDEKIAALEEMIRRAPAHKGGENLRKELHNRLKRFVEKKEKAKKTGRTTQKAIKKEGFQCVLVGLTNGGKSLLLSKLTNAKPRIDAYQFTTFAPEVGTMDYHGVKAQIVDLPSIGNEYFDMGTVNTADCIIIVVENLADIDKIRPLLVKAYGKQIVAINKIDLLSGEQLRKLQETIRSRKIPGLLVSAETGAGTEELKEKIFQNMNSIRVYTKEPGKAPSHIPVVLKIGSTVREVAESILKGFSKKVKESRVSGPSSKFANQKVGLDHVLKDRDIIEFKTF
jgi:ribosome-interacting GTPase 1